MIWSKPYATLPGSRAQRIRELLDRCSKSEASVVTPETDPDQASSKLMDIFRSTGDREAYNLLVDLNHSRLRRIVGSRLRHLSVPLDAGDILQEAFFNIYRYPFRFRNEKPSSFRVWMGAIVSNVIRRHLRRELERFRASSLEMELDADEQADPAVAPLDAAIDQEDREGLRTTMAFFLGAYFRCYETLSARDREVLRLVEVEGLRYREVGNILRTQPANVKMLVFRARQRLFRHMNRVLGGSEKLPLG